MNDFILKFLATFIKLTLTNEEVLKKTEVEYQTCVVKSCSNPVFNETFEFSIPSYELENYSLFIKVYAKRILSRANLIGCIVFGWDYCLFDLIHIYFE